MESEAIEALLRRNRTDLAEKAVSEIAELVRKSIRLLSSSQMLPPFVPPDRMPFTRQDAGVFATKTRGLLKLSNDTPAYNFPIALAHLNVIAIKIHSEDITGGFCILNERAFVYISKLSKAPLFECAYQYAQLASAAARKNCEDIASVTIDSGADVRLNPGPSANFSRHFSENVLIPSRALIVAFRKLRSVLCITDSSIGDIELIFLSRIFGVDFRTMARRCESLGLLPKHGALAMYRMLVDKYDGPDHRAQGLSIPEMPPIAFATLTTDIFPSTAFTESSIHH